MSDKGPNYETLAQAAALKLQKISGVDRINLVIIAGSGWQKACEDLSDLVCEIPAASVEGFLPPVLEGHSGQLRFIRLPAERFGLVLGSRTHLYQDQGPASVVFGVKVAQKLGAKTLIVTNGSGSTTPSLPPGSVVLIADQINLTGTSPLQPGLFVDMTDAYCPELRAIARQAEPSLPEAVYAGLRGPQYETPAEVKMCASLGADLLGMSTVLETIEARSLGIRVLGLSLVTNLAAGLGNGVCHDEVVARGRTEAKKLAELLRKILNHRKF